MIYEKRYNVDFYVAPADLTIHSCQAWPLVATPVRLLHFTLIMEADLPSIFILIKKKLKCLFDSDRAHLNSTCGAWMLSPQKEYQALKPTFVVAKL